MVDFSFVFGLASFIIFLLALAVCSRSHFVFVFFPFWVLVFFFLPHGLSGFTSCISSASLVVA